MNTTAEYRDMAENQASIAAGYLDDSLSALTASKTNIARVQCGVHAERAGLAARMASAKAKEPTDAGAAKAAIAAADRANRYYFKACYHYHTSFPEAQE